MFAKFYHLTFEIFPTKINTVDKVIKLIFSNEGIFKCIDEGCEEAPVTIIDVVSNRAKLFLPTAEVHNLKKKVFNGLIKLEDINKKAR